MEQVLISLLIAVIGALVALVERIRRDLSTNTDLTQQAKDAANGQLSGVLDQLAAVRNQVQGLRAVVRERDDRIAYIVARVPEAEGMMRDYSDRRTSRSSDADVAAAERHLLSADEPTQP